MSSYPYLHPHLCSYFHNVSEFMSSNLLQVSVDRGKLQKIFEINFLFNLRCDLSTGIWFTTLRLIFCEGYLYSEHILDFKNNTF